MSRSRMVALATAVAVVLAGCGTSDKQDVARVLQSYADALAAGDGRAACHAFSPQGQRYEARWGDSFCARAQRMASRLTPAQRREYRHAVAVVAAIKGDRAIAYLRFGNCTATATGTELTRNSSGHWQIFHVGLATTGFEPRCREELPDDIRNGSILRYESRPAGRE